MNGFPTGMIQSLERFQEELAGARSFVNAAARNASSLLIPQPPAAPGTRLHRTTQKKWIVIQKAQRDLASLCTLWREAAQSSCSNNHLLGGKRLQKTLT